MAVAQNAPKTRRDRDDGNMFPEDRKILGGESVLENRFDFQDTGEQCKTFSDTRAPPSDNVSGRATKEPLHGEHLAHRECPSAVQSYEVKKPSQKSHTVFASHGSWHNGKVSFAQEIKCLRIYAGNIRFVLLWTAECAGG